MFKSKKTSEELYKEKLERLETATRVEEPDRVPIAVNTIYFPAKYAGITYRDLFYDYSKFTEAAVKFAKDFDWDAVGFLRSFDSLTLGLMLAGYDPSLAVNVACASVLAGGGVHDLLGDKYSSHPGKELPENVESQFHIEEPFINADEYDKFSGNPFGFLAETIVPRAYKSLERPSSPEAMGTLIKLGIELGKFPAMLTEFIGKMKGAACPPYYMALAPNPLDTLGAFLRNFDTLMVDLYRVPDKVKTICGALAPLLAEVGKATGKMSQEATGSRRVFFPIWYCSYLSPKMWKEFHWAYTKPMIDEVVKAGLTPLMCFQGSADHLLETLLEVPEKKTIAWFDKGTDLRKAKEIIGDHCCIAGGIPPSLLIGGTPQKVEEEVKKLLEDLKPGGGFIFTLPFNAIGDAKVENVKAMTEAVMKYGRY